MEISFYPLPVINMAEATIPPPLVVFNKAKIAKTTASSSAQKVALPITTTTATTVLSVTLLQEARGRALQATSLETKNPPDSVTKSNLMCLL